MCGLVLQGIAGMTSRRYNQQTSFFLPGPEGLVLLIKSLNNTRTRNGNLLRDLTGTGAKALDLLYKVRTLNDLSKHHVGTIEPRSYNGCDEELGAVA